MAVDVKGSDFLQESTGSSSLVYKEKGEKFEGGFRQVKKLFDSFRRTEVKIPEDADFAGLSVYERNNFILAHQPYKKSLSQRHQTMIAIGGALGTGLFIGIGSSLQSGPGALLLGFTIVGISVFCVVQAAAELSCQYPVSGSFATLVSRFLDPSIGFTVSNAYALSWLVSFPNELTGLAITMAHWNKTINPSLWVFLFYLFVVFSNLFAVRGFAESEFWLSIIKIIAVFIFIVIGIVVICGGGPGNTHGYIGAKYWRDPGSFKKPYFDSLCNTFISAAFSFGGTELVILTANESRKVESVSRAAKGTLWRVTVFYLSTVVVIGCLIPFNSPLLNNNDSHDVNTSPFVLALSGFNDFGKNVGHFMNVIVLISVLSVANSSVYAASRVIQSLGACGQLPSIFGYIDRKGRPLVGIATSAVFGLLAFLVNLGDVDAVFGWLFALCSISSFFTWWCICVSQLRYRRALKVQGIPLDDIIYGSMVGHWSGIVGTILNTLLICGEVYVSVKDGNAKVFFQQCLSIPFLLVVYISHKLFFRQFDTVFIRAKDIDLKTGKPPEEVEMIKNEAMLTRARISASSWYYRVYRFWC